MAKRPPRNTTTYRFHGADGEEKHCGITDDPKRRQGEHRRKFNEPDGTLRPEGGKKTRAGARAWEERERCSPFDKLPADPPVPTTKPRTRVPRLTPREIAFASRRRTSSSTGLLGALFKGVAIGGLVALGVGILADVLDGSGSGGEGGGTPPANT